MDNSIYYFNSKQQATLMCALLGRQSWAGGKKCYIVTAHYYPKVKEPDFDLEFDLEVWEKNHKRPDGDGFIGSPPSLERARGFIQGVLLAGGGSVSSLQRRLLG